MEFSLVLVCYATVWSGKQSACPESRGFLFLQCAYPTDQTLSDDKSTEGLSTAVPKGTFPLFGYKLGSTV
jgi:hypothetical protein